ncbi:MAG: hypothetical protein JXR37_26890 [Kiritimatiellae bacterium]|nr:hypothetical protein [Kiritimatiellia bacterium]
MNRMYGAGARDPYQYWFDRVKQREDAAHTNATMAHSLMSLALIYEATSDTSYRDWYLAELDAYLDGRVAACRANPESACGPSFEALVSMDALWAEIPDAAKLKALEASSGINAFYWHSGNNDLEQDFAYHGAFGRGPAFAAAAMFQGDSILSHPDVATNPGRYSLNVDRYVAAIVEEMSSTGTFWQTENRIAGDPAYNSALPGDFGGMYDNFGYDTSEESWSIVLASAYSTFSGQDRLSGFLHDRYRGRYYQQFEIPHTETSYGSGANAYTARRLEVIWSTQTDWMMSPARDFLALTAWKYQDPHMQYYADRWRKEINVYGYDYYTTAIWWMLLFYDDSLAIAPPASQPTSRYFSGPGLVPMREHWNQDAAFAVFVAGEGISRRYEDANSFVLHRNGPVVVHAGARIRFNDDNNKHHWYHIHSISKNTMKIFDPAECFDVDNEGRITSLHSGTPLVDTDNMGGQLFEVGTSPQSGTYVAGSDGAREFRSSAAFPLGIWNTADIRKYEHVADSHTYAVGDASDAYTRKIDFYEREFVYLRPDAFVVFDRVTSADPAFVKAWNIHTVDEPVSSDPPTQTGQGMNRYADARQFTLVHDGNVTDLHLLVPVTNTVTVRGGDTILTTGRPVRSGVDLDGAHIEELEIPRWLELFAVGPDTTGNLVIDGDAEEGSNTTETIVFDGTHQTYQGTTYGFSISGSTLTDPDESWPTNRWVDYMLHPRGGSNPDFTIVANTATSLTVAGTIEPSGVWAYEIRRPMENTYLHWRRITRISTADMDVDCLTLSVPHYFDAEDAGGRLYAFAPHTDAQDDGYTKRTDLGQWTVDVSPAGPSALDNFLTVFSLRNPGESAARVELISGSGVSGALVGNRAVVFAEARAELTEAQFACPAAGEFDVLVMNLASNTTYYVAAGGTTVAVSTADNGGASAQTSAMGVLRAVVSCADVAPAAPANFRARPVQ